MNWNELSEDAKSVIEWVKNPFTDKKEVVTVAEGKYFIKNYQNKRSLRYTETYLEDKGNCKILITKPLYDEIRVYVEQDNNLLILKDSMGFSFCFKDKYNNFENYMNEPPENNDELEI